MSDKTRNCPHCRMLISENASVCPYCRHEVQPIDATQKLLVWLIEAPFKFLWWLIKLAFKFLPWLIKSLFEQLFLLLKIIFRKPKNDQDVESQRNQIRRGY